MIYEQVSDPEEFRSNAAHRVHWLFYVKKGIDMKGILRFTSLSIEDRLLVCDLDISNVLTTEDNAVKTLKDKCIALKDELFPDSTEGEWKF